MKRRNRRKKSKNRFLPVSIVFLCLLLVYGSFVSYYETHFLPKTYLNGKDVSYKSLADVNKMLKKDVEEFVLTIKSEDGKIDKISGSDMEIHYVGSKGVDDLLKKQNRYNFLLKSFLKKEHEVDIDIAFSRDRLDEAVKKLDNIKNSEKKSKSATIIKKNGSFVIEPEVEGKEISIVKLEDEAVNAVMHLKKEIDLSKIDCYEKPRFTKNSKEVKEACKTLNDYLKTEIRYKVGPKKANINKSQIINFIGVDKDMRPFISEEKILEYIPELKKIVDTVGTNRTITAPNGHTYNVVGVNYGWKIDSKKEAAQIAKDISEMKVVEREPIYDYRAESHEANDWGNTYVEVSILNQKAWLIKNGKLIEESPIVSGNPNKNNDTDQGIFIIQMRLKDTVLRGPKKNGKYEWESPVTYWMQFTRGGQGFHDASWQSSFGGQRYKNGYGSRGCVNMPKKEAGVFFENTYAGMPVIIHE